MKPGAKTAKLKFEVNMLPQFVPYMGESLLDALASTNELEIFDEECVIDYIDFNF